MFDNGETIKYVYIYVNTHIDIYIHTFIRYNKLKHYLVDYTIDLLQFYLENIDQRKLFLENKYYEVKIYGEATREIDPLSRNVTSIYRTLVRYVIVLYFHL